MELNMYGKGKERVDRRGRAKSLQEAGRLMQGENRMRLGSAREYVWEEKRMGRFFFFYSRGEHFKCVKKKKMNKTELTG